MKLSILSRAVRGLAALASVAALAGCFLTPGKFDSELILTKGGAFAFSYEGEITTMGLNQLASMEQPASFEAECTDDDLEPRECSAAEVEEQRADWQAEQEQEARQKEQFIKMFGGIDPADPEIAEKLVETLRKMRGWEAVSYRGDGIYDVRFKAEGMLTHSFLFPVVEDLPAPSYFVTATPRVDGRVRVQAPGFGGEQAGMGQGMSMMMAMGAMQDDQSASAEMVLPDGTFTIRTDGEILANNTDDGPVEDSGMKVLVWTVDPSSKTTPMALIGL